jgi:hypothetical protein
MVVDSVWGRKNSWYNFSTRKTCKKKKIVNVDVCDVAVVVVVVDYVC